MVRYPGMISRLLQRCHRVWKVVRGLFQDSPLIFIIVLSVLSFIILISVIFSACVKRVVGAWGTVIVDISLFWLLARFVARVLMFPGSLKLFQRNTEAAFRVEMARQYAHYLRQLWTFLRHAAKQSDGMLRGISADGVVQGYAVIETLAASFRMQEQQHEVKLSKEQSQFHSAAQEVQRWLETARVLRPKGSQFWATPPGSAAGAACAPQPLVDWLRQLASGLGYGGSPLATLLGAELAGNKEDATHGIEHLEQLLSILDELRYQKKSVFSNAIRFFQVPTVGSLNQLRTMLQMRYGGYRCWVPARGGHRLDGMYIPCSGYQGIGEDDVGHEGAPLKGQSAAPPSFSGPVLIWCNPNAAYYETMIYQVPWLNFWLSRGINLFFFNYAGYGRSTGKPSPSRIAEDGEAVIRFLKSKGVTKVGVYGRSIGGVVACHLARHHPEFVQILVADRTMSTLESTAKYMYGSWASKALKATSMAADNVENFLEVRAYKLLVVDPKDTMILDLAALRTAVALRVAERMPAQERLALDEGALWRLEEVWRFFGIIFAICESEDDFGFDGATGHDSSQSARTPTFTRDDPRTDFRLKVGENGGVPSPGPTAGSTNAAADRLVGMQWLEENAGLVRNAMMQRADQVRSALDIVGEHLEGGGVALNDVFADSPNDACYALQCMLANLQVWGTLGDQREEGELAMEAGAAGSGHPYAPGVTDADVERFLRKEGGGDFLPQRSTSQRIADLGRVLTPEMITVYHRRLTRCRVGQIRREFRRRLGTLQHAFSHEAGNSGNGGDAQANELIERLFRTILHHLGEVEAFVSTLSRFFKTVDLAVPYSRQQGASEAVVQDTATHPSDSSDEKLLDASSDKAPSTSAKPQPAVDHSAAGYIMHIDCGHNGVMDDVDMRALALHLRAARFGSEPSDP